MCKSLQVLIERVDMEIGTTGFLGHEQIEVARSAIPELPNKIIDIVQYLADSGDWARFNRYIIAAAELHPDDLGGILVSVLSSDVIGPNREDIVEILGELRYSPGISAIKNYMMTSTLGSPPYFSAAIKCVYALGDIDTHASREVLKGMTGENWPNVLRWHAAVALGVEDDLDFDEI